MKKVYVAVIVISIICMIIASIGVIIVTPSEPININTTGAGDNSSAGVNETEAATATTVNTVLYTNTMNAPHSI